MINLFSMRLKRQLHLISPLLLLVFLISCQEEPSPKVLSPALQKHLEDYAPPSGRWGFLDAEGEIAVKASFDDVRPFNEGLAAVAQDGLWGYINKSGKWKIKPQFIKAYNFSDGLARVRGSNDKVGIINMSQDTVVDFKFDEIYNVQHGLYIADLRSKKGIIDASNKIVVDHDYIDIKIINANLFAVKSDKTFSIIDRQSNIMQTDIMGLKHSNIIKTKTGDGVISDKGEFIIQPKEEFIDRAHEGFFIIKRKDGYGLFNVASQTWDKWTTKKIKYLGEDRYRIKSENGFKLVNKLGESLANREFKSLYNYSGGLAAFQENASWGYIDTDGNIVVDPIFALPWKGSEGKFRLFTGAGFGFHDESGRIVIDPKYLDVRDFSEGMAAYMN